MNIWQHVSDQRMQIYLPEELYLILRETANDRGEPMAKIVRNALIKELVPRRSRTNTSRQWRQLMVVAGLIKDEPRDVAKNTRKYLKEMYRQKIS